MSGEWRESTLVDVSDEVAYGYTESATLERVGPRFLRITDIQSGFVDWRTVPYCPITDSDRQKYRLQSGDIVVARTGNSTGENYLYRGGEEAVFASYLIRYRINQKLADPEFIWYNLRTQRWWEFIEGAKTGSAQAGANARILGQFPIPIPPLHEQRRIAKILGDLDDKIELNRKMNETLEQMARALFKSWFIDFDPVRVKMEGRQPPGMDADTAALFPSRLVESELGLIPEGWEVGTFGSIVASVNERAKDSAAVVLSAVSSSELVRSDENFTKQVFSASISKYKLVRQWDFAYNPSRINIGSIGMLRQPVLGAVSPVYEVFRPIPNYHWFVERQLRQPSVQSAIKTLCSGSVRQSLKQPDLESIQIVVPDNGVVNAFNQRWQMLSTIIENNIHQSRTIASLRDTLLPKLMRGEGADSQ